MTHISASCARPGIAFLSFLLPDARAGGGSTDRQQVTVVVAPPHSDAPGVARRTPSREVAGETGTKWNAVVESRRTLTLCPTSATSFKRVRMRSRQRFWGHNTFLPLLQHLYGVYEPSGDSVRVYGVPYTGPRGMWFGLGRTA